jgi:hypothetical protein
MGATSHPQEDDPKLETIMPKLRSWTLGQLKPHLPFSTLGKRTPIDRTPKPTPSLWKRTQTRTHFRNRNLKPTVDILSSKETLLAQQKTKASLSQHLHDRLSS